MTTLATPVWSLRFTLVGALAGAVLVLTGVAALQVIGGVLVAAVVVLPIARLSLTTRDKPWISDEVMELPLSQLGLSEDVLAPLRTRQITTVGVLLMLNPDLLLKIPGMDAEKLRSLTNALNTAGFLPSLEQEEEQAVQERAAPLEHIDKWHRWLRNSTELAQAPRRSTAGPHVS